MTRRIMVLSAMCFFLAASFGQAQEKYTIKVKDASQGDSYRFTNSETTKSVTKVTDSKGMTLKDTTENSGKSFIYLATVIETGPAKRRPRTLPELTKKQFSPKRARHALPRWKAKR